MHEQVAVVVVSLVVEEVVSLFHLCLRNFVLSLFRIVIRGERSRADIVRCVRELFRVKV